MKLTKLKLTREASTRVRALAGKTGLTPNLVCRLGFCVSLTEPSIPDPDAFPEEDREFNRYTLLGEYDIMFVALLKERCRRDGIDLALLPQYFRAHMSRGIMLLHGRVKSIADVASLLPSSSRSQPAEP